MAKRRSKPRPKPGPSLSQLLTSQLIGSALVVLALMLLLSLLSPTRSDLVAAVVEGLSTLFGGGVWGVPFLVAALGAWMALRDVSQEVISIRRLVGAGGAFLAAEGILHLIAARADPWGQALAGKGAGLLGYAVSQGLVFALGEPIAALLLALLALGSLFLFSGLSLVQIRDGAISIGRWLRSSAPGPEGKPVNPPLPLGQTHWWQRLKGWLSPARSAPPVTPLTSGPPWGPPSRNATAPQPAAPTAPAREPAPRIVGGTGQAWHLPVMQEILEDSSELDIRSEDLRKRAQIIETTLASFGVPVQVVEANQGPAVTQFGLRPGVIIRKDRQGEEKRTKVRVSQIQALANDLSLALAASPIRIEAPVPGRDIVGVEVPNVQISLVALRGVMESEEAAASKGVLMIGLGRDVSGQAVVADLARMPHLLIAGATGSGKSVCVNAIITALLLTHTPETLRFLMIDPKRVELTIYNGIPHLIAPVVVDVERAVPVLQWATREMERRYKLFAAASARNIEAYNEKLAARGEPVLPYIVILIDELADLMLAAAEDVERYICRIAQMARATGMHLVIATQRPSVDVVTGLIKANFPARIAFAVTSQVDSRVILDTPGAEQLLGRGDMLYMAPDASKLLRLQGCFVSDRETARLVNYWKSARAGGLEPAGLGETPISAEQPGEQSAEPVRGEPQLVPPAEPPMAPAPEPPEPPWLPGQEVLQQPLWSEAAAAEQAAAGRDELYDQAVAEVRKAGRASVSLLQRRLRIGYSRAARLIDELEAHGVIGPDQGGTRGREVLPGASTSQGQ